MYISVAQLLSEIQQVLKKHEFFKFYVFVKKNTEITMLSCEKCKIQEKWHILLLTIFPKSFELQRCTIPHFKALDLMFWPLAWALTLGVTFFMHHPLPSTLKIFACNDVPSNHLNILREAQHVQSLHCLQQKSLYQDLQ